MWHDPDLGKSADQLRQERQKRYYAAIDLKVPDRVPISLAMGNFPAKYAGIPCSAAYYDFNAWYKAYQMTLKDFRPDTFGAGMPTSGKALELLDPKTMRWPGHGCDPNHGFQSIEIDGLKADEFDQFMHDPSDYLLRHHTARKSNALAALEKIPPLYKLLMGPTSDQMAAMAFSDPEVAKALETLIKAGKIFRKMRTRQAKFMKLIADYGYFNTMSAAAIAPYDVLSHSLRGMTGTMYDMYRQPAKLHDMCEYLLKMTLDNIEIKQNESGHCGIFMTNTRGSDEFMSKKHFDEFYWPYFKRLVVELCRRGGTPMIFFEGKFDSRVEYLLEFPKGKFIARFDTTDIFRAKEILKGHCCIEGNIPSSLLQVGTKEEVIAYCKKLIDVCGKDGGYILSPRSSTDEVKPENLKAMIDFTKEYGVYR
jgi:uroporphyrinogen-III decarboxylase